MSSALRSSELARATLLIVQRRGEEALIAIRTGMGGIRSGKPGSVELATSEELHNQRKSVDLAMGAALEKSDLVDTLLTKLSLSKEQNAADYSDLTTALYQRSRLFLILLGFVALTPRDRHGLPDHPQHHGRPEAGELAHGPDRQGAPERARGMDRGDELGS